MRRAYFSVADGDESVDVTVITLSISEVLDNVNRWRNELGLDPIKESELDQHAESLEIGGESGHWIHRMESPSDPRRATTAAMVSRNGQMWFFKMTGTADLAALQETNFRQFLQSVKF